MKITLAHGSGSTATKELIDNIFAKNFNDPVLDMMEDSAVVDSSERIAITTDSFVVTPLFFNDSDIGRLSICGTVNDLLMRAAEPKYLTSAFIIEEGADTETLEKIARSMAQTAKEAGVRIVAGDTKVIEGNGGVYINTAGVGFVKKEGVMSAACSEGDALLLSGNLGDHHAAILSARMGIENSIKSDCAPLGEIVHGLLDGGIDVKAMRDITRGGLGTVLNEISDACSLKIKIEQSKLPIDNQVKSFCEFLGLDVLHMGNEGKMAAVVPAEQAQHALEIMKNSKYGENAQIIGRFEQGKGVSLITELGGERPVNVLFGEGLPRIC